MSNPIQTLLQQINQKSITLGWDVLVAYNAQKLNDLFAIQYVNNVKSNSHLPPITAKLNVSPGMQVELTNVTIGPPLISFLTTPGSQVAIVTMSLLAGEVTVLQQIGQVQVAVGYQQIAPGLGLSVQMQVPLSDVVGDVDTHHRVVVNLQNADNFKVNLLPTSAASYIGQYFQQIFQAETSATLTYELGTLITGTALDSLTPVTFDIRTLPNPGTKGQDGAVLLLVATTYNPTPGGIPDSDFPYILPDGNSAALIVASKTLFGNIIQPFYASTLNGSPTFRVEQFSNNSPASYLAFTGGHIDAGAITNSWDSTYFQYRVWSGSKDSQSDASVPFAGLAVQPDNNLLSIQWSGSFDQEFGTSQSGMRHDNISETNVHMTISANFSATATVNQTSQEVSFNPNGQPNVCVNFESSSWVSKWFGNGDIRDKASSQMAQASQKSIAQVFNVPLPQVNTFAVSHLLFPAENYFQYLQAYVPGDLAIFGQIQPSETAFSISPLQSVVAAKQTLQLQAKVANTSWTINPQIGSISQSGLYSAPEDVSSQVSLLVEATAEGEETFAVITLLPNPYSISPGFLLIFPGAGTQQFVASAVGEPQPLTWEIHPPDGSVGTLDQHGFYTPPQTFPTGISIATIQVAALGSSREGIATIFLCSSPFTLNVDPPFAVVPGNESQQFTVPGAAPGSIAWDMQPDYVFGFISENGLFTARNVPGRSVLITATSSDGAIGAGVVVIS